MVKNKKLVYGILVVVILVILGISLFVLNRPTSCKEKALNENKDHEVIKISIETALGIR